MGGVRFRDILPAGTVGRRERRREIACLHVHVCVGGGSQTEKK